MNSPRMTRAERKKQELRKEIVDAAFNCFADRGYHATGIADIAAELGIGHGTFYRYFDNKRDIVDHVITGIVERLVLALAADNAPEAVDSLEGYRDQVARIGESLWSVFGADQRVARFLMLEAAGIDSNMRDRILRFHEDAAQLTATYLDHGVRVGYLHSDLDVAATARAINGMLIAAVLNALQEPDEVSRQQMDTAIRRVMYDGIVAPS